MKQEHYTSVLLGEIHVTLIKNMWANSGVC